MTRLLILDAHSYAYRAFHAIRNLRSPVTGLPTNAIYGFIQSLDRLRAALKPDYLVVVWDGGLAAERTTLLPEYKAQRAPMPTDLQIQIDQLDDYFRAAHIASYCQPGIEADDWIATLAHCCPDQIDQVLIASSDKDFMQLVSARVGLINPSDPEPTVWTAEHVQAKTGVQPAQLVDWLSLVGDTVDNIAGVPGIGPKNASKLLCQFNSLENLYACLDQIKPGSLQQKLRSAESVVRRNQQLIRLKHELPCSFELADYRIGPDNVPELRALFERWGFKTWRQRLEASAPLQTNLF